MIDKELYQLSIATEKAYENDELDELRLIAKDLKKRIRKTKDKEELKKLKDEYMHLLNEISRVEATVKKSKDPKAKQKFHTILFILASIAYVIAACWYTEHQYDIDANSIKERLSARKTKGQDSIGHHTTVEIVSPGSPDYNRVHRIRNAPTIIDVDYEEIENNFRNIHTVADLKNMVTTILP